jgi:signal transduction histidine kinase
MKWWSRSLHAPRGLLILLTTTVALPAATLVWLGVWLLQQDRELEHQHRAEILQDASVRAVNALDRGISELRFRLADPGWPSTAPDAGAIHVALTRDAVRIDPPTSVAYWPTADMLRDMPAAPFREADAAEFERHELVRALDIVRRLAGSSDAAVRAGALVRQGRLLRKLGRINESLTTYSELGNITSVAINGLPADLQARKTRCALFAEQSRTDDLHREAAAIEADLAAGRWRLDLENFEYVEALLEQWLGSRRPPQDTRRLFAQATDWLYRQWSAPANGGFPENGTHALTGATIVWASTPNGVAAVIGGDSYVEREWLAQAQRAAAPAAISLLATADARPVGPSSTAETTLLMRSAAETGLPWAVTISLSNQTNRAPFETRRRTLLAALVAVLVLAAAGSYVIVRTRSREMTLARLQSDFVTAVSHEFRTPLTALLQFNDLLDDSADLSLATRRDYYQAQRRATERLHRLVESLLDFGRMEAGKRQYARERLDAGLLVRDVCDDFRSELKGRSMALRVVIDSQEHAVDADAEALARAVWNLLDNAAKYSDDGREIDVMVDRAGDAVSIAVRDRGIGIPSGEQGRIFQKFTRGAAAVSRRIRGTGIGLAMVQHIVTAHGGTLKVESVEHHGSTFTMVLPAVEQPVVSSASSVVES